MTCFCPAENGCNDTIYTILLFLVLCLSFIILWLPLIKNILYLINLKYFHIYLLYLYRSKSIQSFFLSSASPQTALLLPFFSPPWRLMGAKDGGGLWEERLCGGHPWNLCIPPEKVGGVFTPPQPPTPISMPPSLHRKLCCSSWCWRGREWGVTPPSISLAIFLK